MRDLLGGVRVVEFSQLLSAPVCGLMLGDLGAEVIKVEPPAGEPTRGFPPWLADGESGYFHAVNRGKRGVTANLSDPDEREFARRLIASADVVVENLGDPRQVLGFHYEDVARTHPQLVWCSMTAWGDGESGRAVDPSLQAVSGMIALNGEPEGLPKRR